MDEDLKFVAAVNPSNKGSAVSQLDRKYYGIAYTPPSLAQYVSDKAIDLWLRDQQRDTLRRALRSWRILDPACGEGELLVGAWRALQRHAKTAEFIATANPTQMLCGVDLDDRAVHHTVSRIAELSSVSASHRTHVVSANALCPDTSGPTSKAWTRMRTRFDAIEGFDLVIANPPWGADISSYRNRLSKAEFTLLQGQFDSSDLFVELALKVLKQNGLLAFIVSDSLFNAERTSLRRMLVQQTQIRFIARLGEKFFTNINRACSVIICQKKNPDFQTNVECLRLTPKVRKQILAGTASFAEAERSLLHLVPQLRFAGNRDSAFDIDLRLQEELTMSRLRNLTHTIGDYLSSSRGVELSKYGQVCRCGSCGSYTPKPATTEWECPNCGTDCDSSLTTTIISEQKAKGHVPLLVGESISRYAIAAPMWIRTGCAGIKYKHSGLYKGPKLLVRKTGVGISASIDYSEALTNQVVYIFRPLKECRFPLELFLTVMNSRAMYYFVAKQHGETEWRSHPYVTQSQILSLPFPDLTRISTKDQSLIKDMCRLVRGCLNKGLPPSTALDAKLERFVAELFGLSKRDYAVIFKTLESIEELLPVRALRHVTITDVFKA